MHPAEQTELLLEVATFERQHESDESNEVQCEADEAVIRCERGQLGIGEHNVLPNVVQQQCAIEVHQDTP